MNTQDRAVTDRDARFDTAMRQLHAGAVDHVSGRTRLRLQRAPHQPPASPSPRLRGWPLAASFAAVLALVAGMQLWDAPQPASTVPQAATVATSATDDAGDIDAVLDENPDLYLWLASNDAYALAME